MIGKLCRRVWFPLLCFAATVYAWLLASQELGDINRVAPDEFRLTLYYAIQIGMWLFGAWIVSRSLNVIVWDGLAARSFNGAVPRLLRDVTSGFVMLAAITGIVASVFQRSVAGIWATSGVVSIVLGIALKDVIVDVFTGLFLNMDRPFVIGDWIRVHESDREGAVGQVIQINWRTTRLRTEDNTLVVIPNSKLGSLVITNFVQPTRATRLEALIQIERWVPIERARRVMLAGLREAIQSEGLLADPPPAVLLSNTSNSGFEYKLQYWLTPWSPLQPNRSRDIVQRYVIKHLQRAGIPIAFPKWDVSIRRVPRPEGRDPLVERKQLLLSVLLFRDLSSADAEFVAQHMRPREFRHGDTLIRQGETGETMFVLWEGLVSVHMDPRNNGGAKRVALIGPGEFFGEMSLLTGELRSATVQAESDGCAYEISKDCLSELFRRQPLLLDSISRIVAERRIESDKALNQNADIDRIRQTESLTRQFKERIRNFFRGMMSG